MLKVLKRIFGQTEKKEVKSSLKEKPQKAYNNSTNIKNKSVEVCKKRSIPNSDFKKPVSKKQEYYKKNYTSDKYKNESPKPIEHPIRLKEPRPELIIQDELEGSARFTDFELSKKILIGLQVTGFKYCTPVQQSTFPFVLDGRDVSVKAQTGTGKTAVFLISAFQYLLKNPLKEPKRGHCRVLIIAPTRELVIQIADDAAKLGRFCNFNNLVVYGGTGYKKQEDALNNQIDILVGTPGRLLDFSRRGILNLSKTEIFVIDEADRMLDMGFIPDVTKIEHSLPHSKERQTMIFSATLSDDVMFLIKKWQKNPETIEVETEEDAIPPIEQFFYSVKSEDKNRFLLWLFKNKPLEKVLIFVNTKDQTFRVKKYLEKHNFKPAVLSSDIAQTIRIRTLDDFKKGKINIIIATDVASRGIHVDNVSHVINYDIPERAEDYVHRIGRTGRAGKTGESISFICEYGSYYINEIEKVLGNEIKCLQPESYMIERHHAK